MVGRVYPRVCGGTAGRGPGPEPRVCGGTLGAKSRRVYPRVCGGTIHLVQEVYPRDCGGTAPIRSLIGGFSGLSPRVRGNRHAQMPGRDLVAVGSIPACAGEPGDGLAVVPSSGDGLSPRVRGNRQLGFHGSILRLEERSIPACAGEPGGLTPLQRIGMYQGSIPACAGEPSTRATGRRAQSMQGLSPRVRGNRQCCRLPNSAACTVYPRVCGGTLIKEAIEPHSLAEGLSPRVRGNPLRRRAILASDKHGLSPRVRGNRSGTRLKLADVGSIPACAGEPMVP